MNSWRASYQQSILRGFAVPKPQNPWIDAYSDPKANLQTFSSCLALSDLNADNDFKLVVGDSGNGIQTRLKVYKGTNLSVELPLLTQPVAVACVYTDRNEPRIPGIIVAAGSNVLVYRNCRPYFKFTLPSKECNTLEVDVWHDISSPNQLVQILKDLSLELGFSNLSSPSQNLLLMNPNLREEFINSSSHFMVKKQMIITCVTTLSKYASSGKDVSVVLLATESAQLFVMDPETFTVISDFTLPDVCCTIHASGVYLVDYCVVVGCRNGKLFTLRVNNLRYVTQMLSHAVSLLLLSHKIVTANMDSTLNCYNFKGRKYWTLSLPENPLHATDVPLSGLALHLVAVSLSHGNIYLYNDSNLVHIIPTNEPVHSMVFGRYGQEEHALISISSSGAMDIRLLKRTAHFSNNYRTYNQTSIRSHDIKFLVPKKSKLFLEQSLRERENCREMHAWFNYSWTGLKVLVCESYVNALHSAAVAQNESLKMITEVIGLGPRIKLKIHLSNMSLNIMPMNTIVTFIYDSRLYQVHDPVLKVPLMVHGVTYSLETLVSYQMSAAGVIQVAVVSSTVHLSTIIQLPESANILE